MNRRQRLRRLATIPGMKEAAAVQAERRGDGSHPYVVGHFCKVNGRVMLRCVYAGPAYDIPRPPAFTYEAERFNRWRTRQAAHQFVQRWKLDAHVFDIGYLDVFNPVDLALA